MKLEVCVADPQSLAAAIEGGAERIELCSALELGGLTPLPGLMALAAASGVETFALVRPRSGDFVFDSRDLDAMLRDIAAVRQSGLAGVVLGANHPDGTLDHATLARLLDEAEGLGTTLHRAIDLVPDFAEATETAIALGFDRILTSGGAQAGQFARPAGRRTGGRGAFLLCRRADAVGRRGRAPRLCGEDPTPHRCRGRSSPPRQARRMDC